MKEDSYFNKPAFSRHVSSTFIYYANMILTFCEKKQVYGCMNTSSERILIRYVERRYGKAASIPVTK